MHSLSHEKEVINMKTSYHQKTKIVATVGPACSSLENLKGLAKAGVDIFRLNFSHGTHEDHLQVIKHILAINESFGTYIGILADLQGPKLRVGTVQEGGIHLKNGESIRFVNEKCMGTKDKVYMSYSRFAMDVTVGERVLCDDGKIVFKVKSTDKKTEVVLEVVHGGILESNKGVNLPDTEVSLPSLTKKDRLDLDFILTQPVNWIALSFVRKAKDIIELKDIIESKGHDAKVISKIEKPEALKNIKEIIKASNAIMIARGDLGVEMPMEQIPSIQKSIIKWCIQRARPVIVATQMMESMIKNPSPSRAEITDVANAVLDGTDAVMLSGETSVGDHPAEVVKAMSKIVSEAEKNYELKTKRPKAAEKSGTFYSDVLCITAAKVAEEIKAKAIVGLTVSGYTAYKVSSYRPKADICIFSNSSSLLKSLSLVWGVKCFHYDKFTTTDGTIEDTIEILRKNKIVKKGDTIINTGSMPLHKRFRTNMLKISIVGE